MFPKPIPTIFLLCLTIATQVMQAHATTLTEAEATALRERFEARQRNTQTWVSSFTQTLSMPGLRDPITSLGTISYRSPDSLKMEFTKPEGELVLVTGDQLFVSKAGRKPTVKSLKREAGKPFLSLLGLLHGKPVERSSEYSTAINREPDRFVLVLTRKPEIPGANSMPKKITNILNAETLDVVDVLVELPNGATLRFEFYKTERNRPFEAGHFDIPDLT